MCTVLVVDDDASLREALTDVLVDAGHRVLAAQHGAEALALLRKQYACIILLDLLMPVMDGAEFRHMQLQDERLRGIPFVLMTGKLRPVGLDAALGAVACLRKPFDPTDLFAALRRADCVAHPV